MKIRESLRKSKELLLYNLVYIQSRNIRKKMESLNILDDNDTVNEIVSKRLSISRFGDGEFCYILNCVGIPKYQERNNKLVERLKEVLTSEDSDVLVCIPKCMVDNKKMLLGPRCFWSCFTYEKGNKIYKYFKKNKVYGNTNFSRFYIDLKDKSEAKNKIENIKKIWKDRNITIVEGNKSKLGVGNDLFKNCSSIKRIICPAENAFSKYEEILSTIDRLVSKDDLVLIALGPTATILAYDLSKLGYQALDIGHVDIEYEWYLSDAQDKIPIKGKMVNEVSDKSIENVDIENDKYKNSIIAIIK